jgi:hypothetical protein
MRDVTLNSGKTMTDAEFIKERGFGDAPTDFVATKADLVLLADKLVDKLLAADFFLMLQVSLEDIDRRDYISFRLNRVMHFLPELEDEVGEKLRLGYEKNEADEKKYSRRCFFEDLIERVLFRRFFRRLFRGMSSCFSNNH